MQGGGTLPDPVLRVNAVAAAEPRRPGRPSEQRRLHRRLGEFLAYRGTPGYPIELSAMALGSIPPSSILDGNLHDEILVVDNANIFDNLTIKTPLPIRFKTDGVHVGGLAPTFVQN